MNQLTPAQPGGTNILRFKFGTLEVLPADCTLEDNTNPAGPINHLFANVHNSMSKDAPDVKTTFRFANWGIPPVDPSVPAWAPAGGTPSAGLVNPPNNQNPTDVKIVTNSTPAPAIGATFQLDWELTRRQSCDFAKGGNIPGNGHFCMLAEIQSSDPGVHFVNNAARRNMNFVTLSAFSDTAEISAVGYKGPIQEFMLTVDHEVRSYRPTAEGSFYCESSGQTAPPKTATTPTAMQNKVATTVVSSSLQRDEFTCIRGRAFPKGLTQAMIWVARGYRKTGEFLIINNRKYELVDGVGGFGYVAGHNGPVAKWTQELTGDFAPSDPKAKDEKLIEITTGQTKIVNVRIEAKEQRESKFAVFADLGVGIPNGAFGNVFNPGFSLNGGLEYIINPHFSAEGILGYHHFPSKGVGDVNVFQFGGGGKVYSPPIGNNNFLFARAGLGGYHFSFSPGSTTNFGGYVGGGLLHQFNSSWGLEGVYTFHTVNTPGTATRFSTVQGGVRYVFP
ncbi:MAG: porin family protein [Acidobacteriia bacterium]|nr:porin family protein [Terriglobia bacterium]